MKAITEIGGDAGSLPEQTLYDFLEGRVDADTRRRIQTQMKIDGSPVQRWFAELQQWARNAYDIDWKKLIIDEVDDGQGQIPERPDERNESR